MVFAEDHRKSPFQRGALPLMLGESIRNYAVLDLGNPRASGELDIVTYDLQEEERRFEDFVAFLEHDLGGPSGDGRQWRQPRKSRVVVAWARVAVSRDRTTRPPCRCRRGRGWGEYPGSVLTTMMVGASPAMAEPLFATAVATSTPMYEGTAAGGLLLLPGAVAPPHAAGGRGAGQGGGEALERRGPAPPERDVAGGPVGGPEGDRPAGAAVTDDEGALSRNANSTVAALSDEGR
jgi:hypothetical protein